MVVVDTIYLSSDLPRVPLVSEDDLRWAVGQGLLEESHFLDLKREVKSGKGENRELARDLASFAIDSGTLLVGVDERADGTLEFAPQPLAGLPERIERVAIMVPDPPLVVVTHRIPSNGDPTTGYLIVHVPASPTAPHMVDNRYLGRGDKTKRYLSDAEVLRLHERRRSAEADAVALLEAEFARDPVPAEIRRQAHLFLLAEPLTARPGMLLHLTDGDGWQQRLLTFAHERGRGPEVQEALAAGKIEGFSPDLGTMQDQHRRPGGAALTSYALAQGRVLRTGRHDPETVAELEVYEDGGLRIFMSRLSDHLPHSQSELGPEDQVLFDAALVVYARRLVALVLGAAEEGGYFGNWALGTGATGLRGCYSYRQTENWLSASSGPRYSEDVYRRATVASYAELKSRPGEIADRLVGQLLRAFGTWQVYAVAFADPIAKPTT